MFETGEKKCLVCKRQLYRYLFDSDDSGWKERFCCEEHRDTYLCPPSYPFVQTTASSQYYNNKPLTMAILREAIDLLDSTSHVNCRCVSLKRGKPMTTLEAFENVRNAFIKLFDGVCQSLRMEKFMRSLDRLLTRKKDR